MNRLSLMHTGARTDFPVSLTSAAPSERPLRQRIFVPVMSLYLGIAGFMGCGAVVILVASLIALRIH